MPINSMSRARSGNVGGVSGRAGVRAGGSNPSAMTPSRVVAVEGILVAWKAALFAGRRRNGGLGRSVSPQRGSSRGGGAPMTADVRRAPRRGTSSRMRSKAYAPAHAREIVACARQTRPSLGPSTRARRSSLHTEAPKASSWWGDRSGITVGQTRASGRNQHWGRTGGRSAARLVSPLPQGRGRGA